MVKSAEHDASNFPALSKARPFTVLVWALTDLSLLNSSHSQTTTDASSEPETNKL
jgi:hypothetical protein